MFSYLSIAALLLALLLILLTSYFIRIVPNYREAKKLGLPILITPFSYQNPVWLAIGPYCSFLRHLPFGIGNWVQYSTLGWELEMRHRLVSRLGPAIAIVSPDKTEITLADPAAGEDVANRWREWEKPYEVYAIFDIFGKSVNTVNGKDWQRHRKITGPAFKESTNQLVWDESINQAVTKSREWAISEKELTLKNVYVECCTISMNVLMVAGFGTKYESSKIGDTATATATGKHTMSYGETLRVILQNLFMVLLFSDLRVPGWMTPKNIKKTTLAMFEFRQYMEDKLTEGMNAASDGQPPKHNLMSALVEANEAAKEEGGRTHLSSDELHGNMFIFNVAGFETTATALNYSFPLLAANNNVQEWVATEVKEILGEPGSVVKGTYQHDFPRLVRVMAVMHETLRLWGTVQTLIRTSSEAQVLQIKGKPYMIPPCTNVTVNINALHCDPSIWGNDSLEWRPRRWIKQSSTGEDMFAGPPEGAVFLPWSWGPRICPGKKFSQVEFVAVVAVMLRDYRVEPARRDNESLDQSKARLLRTVQDSYFNISPRMRKPEDAGLAWKPRH